MSDDKASAWRVDDQEWVRERKIKWKSVEQSLRDGFFPFNKLAKKAIKHYFMTGKSLPAEDFAGTFREPDFERPLYFIEGQVLLECWLSPDASRENWDRIKSKYEDWRIMSSRRFFRQQIRKYPRDRAIFDGHDKDLYYFFGPTRCRRQDYPSLSDDEYMSAATDVSSYLGSALWEFLVRDYVNPHDFTPLVVDEYLDSLVPMYERWIENGKNYQRSLSYISCIVRDIISHPERKCGEQVLVANIIYHAFDEMDLPAGLRDEIEEGRRKPVGKCMVG